MSKQVSNEIIIRPPVVDQQARETTDLADRAKSLVIEDEESHAEALIILQDAKALRVSIDNEFEPPRSLSYATWKSIVALCKKFTDPLDAIIAAVGRMAVEFEARERKRAEAAAREEERLRREQELAAAEAEAAAEEDPVAAAEILEAAREAPAPMVAPEPRLAKVAGVHSTERWGFEVDDKLKVIQHALAHPEHLEGVDLVMKYWNGLAKSQRSRMRIPGGRAVPTTTKTVRA